MDEMTYDQEADAFYLALRPIAAGEAVEQVIVGREGKGDVILDFSASGELLGIEVIGARGLLAKTVLDEAEQLWQRAGRAGVFQLGRLTTARVQGRRLIACGS